MAKHSIPELIGRRVLVKNDHGVQEVRIVEMSPSRKWTGILEHEGEEYEGEDWIETKALATKILEVLPNLPTGSLDELHEDHA